jgi:hypothetical protein
MKLVVGVLVILFLVELLSSKNEKTVIKKDEVQENVLHPAAHQLR